MDDVYRGMIAFDLARHIVDLIRRDEDALERDNIVSLYRSKLNWKDIKNNSIDPYINMETRSSGFCDLCGPWRPIYRKRKRLDDERHIG